MKTWLTLLLLAASGRVACGAEAPRSPLLWTYEYLLATSRDELDFAIVVDQAIEESKYSDLPSFALPDFAAQVLLDRLDDPGFPPGGQIRLLQVLISAKSHRYDPVYLRVLDAARDPRVSSWARSARRRSLRSPDEPYAPGSVDTRTIVAEAEDAALAARPTREQRAHFAAFTGSTLDELFAWSGVPHHVSSWRSRYPYNSLTVVPNQLNFYYRGQGRVVFGFDHLEGRWVLLELTPDPLAFEDEFPYRARAAQLGLPDDASLAMAQVLSESPAAMRLAARHQLDASAPSQEFLDTVAEILATAPADTDDGIRTDAYAWMCRLLAQRGGIRYAPLLVQLSERTGSKKLRRHALQPVAAVADARTGAYVPGTVSLATQRAKYPSPYAE